MKKTFTSALLVAACFGAQVQSQDLSNGLVAYYPFNGDVKDYSGNGFDFSATTKVFENSHDVSSKQAIAFNGTADRKLTSIKNVNFGGKATLTASMWIQSTQQGLNYFVNGGPMGMFTNLGSVGMAISTPSTNAAIAPVADQTKWIHLVGTYDGTTITAYVNGSKLKDAVNAGASFGDFIITVGGSGSSYWQGLLDDLIFYNRVLSAQEIEMLYLGNQIVTGVEENSFSNVKAVYPNPATDKLFYHFSQTSKAKIMDMLGNELGNLDLGLSGEINVAHLSKGSYILVVAENGKTTHHKFYKQ